MTARTIQQALLLRVANHYSNESDLEYNIDTGIVRLRRLDPVHFSSSSSSSRLERKVLHGDGLHLVTGGTGGIGTELVQWLINVQGVQPHDIVLLTRRSGPHPMEKKYGVQMITLDVSQKESWNEKQLELLKRITTKVGRGGGEEEKKDTGVSRRRRKIKRVVGIYHLAGTLDDGMVRNMTKDRMNVVALPKVHGLLRLLELAKKWQWRTKYALVFSSTTSLLGYPGQANYAAANSMLDGFATTITPTFSFLQDVPILSCNWGPWGEVGMAKVGSKPYNQALKNGELPMETNDALRALEALFRSALRGRKIESTQCSICRVEWSRSKWSNSSMLAEIKEEEKVLLPSSSGTKGAARKKRGTGSKNEESEDSDDDDDDDAPEDEIELFFAARVSSWMPSETLTALGVDSLDEVQLRNDFQREFRVSVPLSMFVVPNQTLSSLCTKLRDHMASRD